MRGSHPLPLSRGAGTRVPVANAVVTSVTWPSDPVSVTMTVVVKDEKTTWKLVLDREEEDVLDDVGVICVRDGSSLNELGWTKDNEVKKTGRVADNVVKGKWRQQMRTKARIAEARSQHNQGKQGYQ